MITEQRKTRGIHRRGTRAVQPAANDVLPGTIYFVTDEFLIERSDGSAWETNSVDLRTGIVVNSTGAASNTRIAGDNNANLLFIDAVNDRVGIGTGAPDSQLEVNSTSGDCILKVNSPAGSDTYLKMLEEGALDSGAMIKYDGAINRFEIGTFSAGAEVPALYFSRGSQAIGMGALVGTPSESLEAATNTAAVNNTVQSVFAASVNTTGTAAIGYGARISLNAENASGNKDVQVAVAGVWTDPAEATATADMLFYTRLAGAILAEKMRLTGNGRLGLGVTPAVSALLELSSTIGALLLSRMTTTQRDALTAVNGMLIYNSTLNKFQGYENGVWTSLI